MVSNRKCQLFVCLPISVTPYKHKRIHTHTQSNWYDLWVIHIRVLTEKLSCQSLEGVQKSKVFFEFVNNHFIKGGVILLCRKGK